MIQLSCADYAFPLLRRTSRLALVRLLGFRSVDLGLFERSLDLKPSQLARESRFFIRRARSDLRSNGLRASDLFLQTSQEPSISAVNHPSPRVRARNRNLFVHALDLCSALDCKHLTGLPGVFHRGTPKPADLSVARQEAAWRLETAAAAGVQYAIEPHLGSICTNIARTNSFVHSVPGLTLTLDYGHFVAAGASSREVHALLSHASHLHARAASPKRLQTAFNENQIDFAGLIHGLQRQRYRGFVALEYVWTTWGHCNRVDNVSETLLLKQHLERAAKGYRAKEESRRV